VVEKPSTARPVARLGHALLLSSRDLELQEHLGALAARAAFALAGFPFNLGRLLRKIYFEINFLAILLVS